MSLEALLHIDSIETLVEGEGQVDFQHCLNHQYSSDSRCGEELRMVICNSSMLG